MSGIQQATAAPASAAMQFPPPLLRPAHDASAKPAVSGFVPLSLPETATTAYTSAISGLPSSSSAMAPSAERQMPELITLKPSGYNVLSGMYKLVPGGSVNGEPVWCSMGWRLFSGKRGHWLLSSCEAEMFENRGYIRSAEPHAGRAPHEVTAWQAHTGCGWEACTATLFEIAEGPADAMHSAIPSSCSSMSTIGDSYFNSEFDDLFGGVARAESVAIKPKGMHESPVIHEDELDGPFSLDAPAGDVTDAASSSFGEGLGHRSSTLSGVSSSSSSSALSGVSSNPRTLLHFLKASSTPPVGLGQSAEWGGPSLRPEGLAAPQAPHRKRAKRSLAAAVPQYAYDQPAEVGCRVACPLM